ncbi:DNA processing protein DprA [Roseovarius sp. B08]|uniref:DprA-like winged helix domain-containing protein n=1 Tax=Roseovarius sp. B08 TaxID=3449223 RepID=UPI003EDBBD9E
MLIRDGATLVRNADDVLAALPAPSQPVPPPQPELRLAPPPEKRSLAETARLHTDILNRLGPAPLAEDQLIRDLSAPAAQVSPALTDLEVTGKITRHPGGLVSRT